MNTLQIYILKRVAAMTLIVYAAVVSIFATTQVLNQVALLLASSHAALKGLLLAALMVPQLTVVLLPFALLLGTIAVLTTMNRDSEIVAFEAAGGGRSIVAVPIYALGGAVASVCLATSLFLEAPAHRQLPELMRISGTEIMRSIAGTAAFRRLGDGLFFWMGEEQADGGPGGIFVADSRDAAEQIVYTARQASLLRIGGKDLLTLSDGVRQSRNAGSGEILSIGFQSYVLDLAALTPVTAALRVQPDDVPTADLLAAVRDKPLAGGAAAPMRAELHRRLSEWLYPLAFAAIGVYFGGSARLGSARMRGAVAAILAAMALRGFGIFAHSGAGTSPAMAALGYAAPISVAVLFIWLAFARRTWPMRAAAPALLEAPLPHGSGP